MVLVAVVDAALANIDERWIGLPIGVFVALGVAAHEGQRGLSSELFLWDAGALGLLRFDLQDA